MSPLQLPSFMTGASAEMVVSVIFTLVFIWWAIYSAVAVYHWARFGRSSWVAVPALAIHLAVSGGIFVFMTSGLQ
ncbi:hypothetical protein K2Y00_03945 [Patescibacteria group bacterium]|nr:hypothetical protein [Patescibacteria group bacterium]